MVKSGEVYGKDSQCCPADLREYENIISWLIKYFLKVVFPKTMDPTLPLQGIKM